MEELKISISIIGFPHIGKFFTPWASSLCLLIITFSEISFLNFYKAWGHVFFYHFYFSDFFLACRQENFLVKLKVFSYAQSEKFKDTGGWNQESPQTLVTI